MFQLERRQQLILLALAAILLFGASYRYAVSKVKTLDEGKPVVKQVDTAENTAGRAREVVVHVAGAVEKPGIYSLPPGSRVDDAVKQAGLLPDADVDKLNLAALLTDGQKVHVPLHQTVQSAGTGRASGIPTSALNTGEASGSQGLININTAGKAELETLPGIGPAMADRIIQYREEKGPFSTAEDIKNVSGIGEKRYEQLKDKITIF